MAITRLGKGGDCKAKLRAQLRQKTVNLEQHQPAELNNFPSSSQQPERRSRKRGGLE